jgi:hypothetical protein
MTKDEALKLALEALESERPYLGPMPSKTVKAITAIKQARSAPTVQEPVAQWQLRHHLHTDGIWENCTESDAAVMQKQAQTFEIRRLYTAPPAAPVQKQIELAKQIWREDQQRIAELSAEIDRLTAAQPAPVQEPASSNVQAKWLGNALFDCIKASGIIREDIGSLSVGELLFFSKDLKGMLERQAATPPTAQPAPVHAVDGTQVSKVWWDGEKLMAKPIPLEDFYQPVQEPVHPPCNCGRKKHEMHLGWCAHAESKVEWAGVAQKARHRAYIEAEWLKLNPPSAQPAPVQEPVACRTLCELCVKRGYNFCANAAKTTPIITTPPAAQRQFVWLTEQQKQELAENWFAEDWAITKAIGMMYDHEAKLRSKNNG